MNWITKLGAYALIFASTTSVTSSSSVIPIEAQVIQPVAIQEVWQPKDTLLLIAQKAEEYHVSRVTMEAVVSCETGGDIASTTIQSRYMSEGQQEQSYGIVQIHLPSNPEISYEQATDPHFAIDFLAKRIKEGKGGLWTCYRLTR